MKTIVIVPYLYLTTIKPLFIKESYFLYREVSSYCRNVILKYKCTKKAAHAA